MPVDSMTNTRDYLTSLVDDALATIAYHATDNPAGVHIAKTVKALEKMKMPRVSRSVDMTDNVAQRRESGDYTTKKCRAIITISLDIAITTRDTAGAGLLMDEYNRVQELIEYALEDSIPGNEGRNDYYIINTDRVALVGETPLFDDEAMTGSAMLVFELNYDKERR